MKYLAPMQVHGILTGLWRTTGRYRKINTFEV